MELFVDRNNKIDTSRTENGKTYGAGTLFITGAGYYRYPFTRVAREGNIGWSEPTWGAELTRSTSFALSNIDTAKFSFVDRVAVSFKYMNVADYKALMAISRERVCYVTFYNSELCEWVEDEEMALTTKSLDTLYLFNTDYIGNLNTKIELVATNRDKTDKKYTVTLKANGGTFNKSNKAGITVASNTSGDVIQVKDYLYSIQLKDDIYTKFGYHISHWATTTTETATTKKYYKDALITVSANITLYPIWEAN